MRALLAAPRHDARTAGDAGATGTQPEMTFFVPGRIEVLGKHTDYAGGRSLLAAVDRGIRVTAVARDHAGVTITDRRARERITFPIDPALEIPAGWAAYPMTVARRLARNFPGPLRGADITIASDLPEASGLSSSTALVIACFLVLASVNDLGATTPFTRNIGTLEELAAYLARVENGGRFRGLAGGDGVGTDGGAEDQIAILCARPGEVLRYRFAPFELEAVIALPADHVFAIACSGVRAEKAGAARGAYNRAAELTRIAASIWRESSGRDDATLGEALASGPQAAVTLREAIAAARHTDASAGELLDRVDQFNAETNEIIPAAAAALAGRDLERFGALVDRSHGLACTHLHNQVAETEHLARSARALGAVAASAFGAGFGGSVWALVPEAASAQFLEEWRACYIERFPVRAGDCEFFASRAAGPAVRLS